METKISKWGNSAGVIIPADALSKARLNIGDVVDVEARIDGEIIFKRIGPAVTLESLLEAAPKTSFELDSEDLEWLHAPPTGKEVE